MSTNSSQECPRLPLVLGVVGHRDIRPEDGTALRAAVKDILCEFLRDHPHTPLVILSALAEGADQLVAEVALEVQQQLSWGGQVQVRAPLPFPLPVYLESSSFEGAPARGPAAERCREWVSSKRVDAFVVPLPGGPALDDEAAWQALSEDPEQRRICYANVGGYIVRHCHALIALWDGVEAPVDAEGRPKLSGTAEVVRFQHSGEPPAKYPWIPPPLGYAAERGPVLVVHTPRAAASPGSGSSSRPAGARYLWLPGALPEDPDGAIDARPCPPRVAEDLPLTRRWSDAERFRHRLASALGWHRIDAHEGSAEVMQLQQACLAVDDYNRDIEKGGRRLEGEVRRWRERLLDDDPTGPDRLPAPLEDLGARYQTASSLARALDARLERSHLVLFGALVLAVVAFHAYAHLSWISDGRALHAPIFLVLFLAALAVAGGMVLRVWWRSLDLRRLDYRALAEAYRVRFYWAVSGIDRSVADSYMTQLRGEMGWTRQALLHTCPPPQSWEHLLRDQPAGARLKQVFHRWVEGQAKFYSKHHSLHLKATRCRFGAIVLAFIGWCLAALLLIGARHPNHVLLLSSGLLVIAGGFAMAHCERRSYEELAKQYHRMHGVFIHGGRLLCQHLEAGDEGKAREALVALGIEAITEHAQWLILRRARPFELVIH